MNYLWEAYGLRPISEYRFCPDRKWRFDYVFLEHKIAVEIEGGIWTRGRHTRGEGYLNDLEKYNRAAKEGWCVLRFPPTALTKGIAQTYVLEVISNRLRNVPA